MDSNFSVKITADISDLQSRLKAVEVELGKFSKSADKASTSMKNMEQNANRSRMVAFAFGQVVRDAGFFSQSFGLGLLAISNNIPILIDQISLSVKALAPFTGALSLAGSILTALLTIWAYSASAVKKNKETLDDYIKSLNDVREAQLKAAISADDEIRTLELLRRAAQNETFSRKERLKAVKELQERFPDYYASLSAEAIMAGKDADNHNKLARAIRAVAEAEAYKELIKENKKVELTNSQKLIDLQAERVKLQKQLRDLEATPTGITGSKTGRNEKLEGLILAKKEEIFQKDQQIFAVAKERNKARDTANTLEERLLQTLEKQKKVVVITGDFGGVDNINKKTDAFVEYSNAIKSINANQTTTELEKLNAILAAQKTLLDSLSKETYPGVAQDMKLVGDSMGETKNQIIQLETSAKNLKEFNDKLETFKGISEELDKRKLDILSGVGVTEIQKGKLLIEALTDSINKFKDQISKTNDPTLIDYLNKQILILKLELAGVSASFNDALNIEIAVKNATEWTQYLAQTVGGDLVDAFNQMLTTGKLSFESIGRALLGMIKKLAAAAMAAAVLSAILSSIFPGAGGNGFKEIFGKITGINLAGNSIPGAALTTNSSGINTSMATSSAMGSSSSVLETRVSGNDLVILLDRASNNRNKYF
jgi:hypothetical protein